MLTSAVDASEPHKVALRERCGVWWWYHEADNALVLQMKTRAFAVVSRQTEEKARCTMAMNDGLFDAAAWRWESTQENQEAA
jgi:ligand-binding SRPBCC domain-containing protein